MVAYLDFIHRERRPCSPSSYFHYYKKTYLPLPLYQLQNNALYLLNISRIICNMNGKLIETRDKVTNLKHYRLGHINEKHIKKMYDHGYLGRFDFESIGTCESCLMGKMVKTSFSKKGERAKDLLELIHSDVCGPISVLVRSGFQYFITFTDNFSRYGYVYLMRHKSESFEKFKEFKNEMENQLDKKIKVLRSDQRGEYLSHEFGNYLKECGIVTKLTPPRTTQWNGVSERRNQTLLDMVRLMVSKAELPIFLELCTWDSHDDS